jgi:hypothetical protein
MSNLLEMLTSHNSILVTSRSSSLSVLGRHIIRLGNYTEFTIFVMFLLFYGMQPVLNFILVFTKNMVATSLKGHPLLNFLHCVTSWPTSFLLIFLHQQSIPTTVLLSCFN